MIFLETVFLIASLLAVIFSIFEFRMVLGYWKSVRERSSNDQVVFDRTGHARPVPPVLVQLPLYNEGQVVAQLIERIADLEYPQDALHIQILDDSTDDTPAQVETALSKLSADKAQLFEHIRRGNRDGYKAGALAYGMKIQAHDFIAVFDADFLPPTDFLKRALLEKRYFDEAQTAFVQARWTYYNGAASLFTKVQSILLDRHFLVQKPYQAATGDHIIFNGSAGIWRRKAIEDAGGWSGRSICEDLDLTCRCILEGYDGIYAIDLECPNEVPSNLQAFKLQQRRWAKGTAQNMVTSLPAMFGYGSARQRFNNVIAVSGYLIHPILLMYAIVWPILVLGGTNLVFLWTCQLALIIGNIGAISAFVTTFKARKTQRTYSQIMPEIVFALALGISLMVNNSIAFTAGLFSKGGEFQRTPKVGQQEQIAVSTQRFLRPRLHWSLIFECALAIYALTTSMIMLFQGYYMEMQQTFLFGAIMAVSILAQALSAARLRLDQAASA